MVEYFRFCLFIFRFFFGHLTFLLYLLGIKDLRILLITFISSKLGMSDICYQSGPSFKCQTQRCTYSTFLCGLFLKTNVNQTVSSLPMGSCVLLFRAQLLEIQWSENAVASQSSSFVCSRHKLIRLGKYLELDYFQGVLVGRTSLSAANPV